jgi:hypothetical protein
MPILGIRRFFHFEIPQAYSEIVFFYKKRQNLTYKNV